MTHSLKLKDACNCPYELILPENMCHNQFDYENDLIFPLKEFLKRHTHFKKDELSDIVIPKALFEFPDYVMESIKGQMLKKRGSAMFSCFNYDQ
jgi:hypothetical protein